MGHRRLKISMGTPVVAPEAGDASASMLPSRKRHPEVLNMKNHDMYYQRISSPRCPLINLSNGASVSILNETLYNDVTLIENGVLEKLSNPASVSGDSYGFPYYRSDRRNRQCQDAVLVKDVGVSCTILQPENESLSGSHVKGKMSVEAYLSNDFERNKNSGTAKSPKRESLEGYLLNQLKMEYSDLSAITRKISAYTKDILQSLSSSSKRKISAESTDSSKEPVAEQYTDESGNPCLKLRLKDSACTPTRKTVSDNLSTTPSSRCHQLKKPASKGILEAVDDPTHQTPVQQEKEAEQIFPKNSAQLDVESSICSSSSIYNYLMMGKKRSSMKKRRQSAPNCLNLKEKSSERHPKKHSLDYVNDREAFRVNDLTYSKTVHSANKNFQAIPDFQAEYLYVEQKKNVYRNGKEHHQRRQNEDKLHYFTEISRKCSPASFHTVNIRIVRHKHKDQ
ncbi:uncharacterized protein LOC105701141 isoform X2 [Orussus abietinus]|uniref:uncharacterized protein LOC105701141 isoform X2 n=1 Tax=Orussus abietinus TaxID=222816 RepID=UPI00062665C4|nr:uncharacterized protein LOC105701141 isoform X2 [Orussus abietinus]